MILFRRVHSSHAVVVHMQSRLAFDIPLYTLLLTLLPVCRSSRKKKHENKMAQKSLYTVAFPSADFLSHL